MCPSDESAAFETLSAGMVNWLPDSEALSIFWANWTSTVVTLVAYALTILGAGQVTTEMSPAKYAIDSGVASEVPDWKVSLRELARSCSAVPLP